MINLWVQTDARGSPGAAVRIKVKDIKKDINRQAASRGVMAVNAIRNAELEVLKGQRSGKVYKKPGTHGAANKVTRELRAEYGHKLRGGQLYRASAPGEAPARRTENLRLHWSGDVRCDNNSSGGVRVSAVLESQEKYAAFLENGKGMAPRPFVDKIKEKAVPEIKKIYNGLHS